MSVKRKILSSLLFSHPSASNSSNFSGPSSPAQRFSKEHLKEALAFSIERTHVPVVAAVSRDVELTQKYDHEQLAKIFGKLALNLVTKARASERLSLDMEQKAAALQLQATEARKDRAHTQSRLDQLIFLTEEEDETDTTLQQEVERLQNALDDLCRHTDLTTENQHRSRQQDAVVVREKAATIGHHLTRSGIAWREQPRLLNTKAGPTLRKWRKQMSVKRKILSSLLFSHPSASNSSNFSGPSSPAQRFSKEHLKEALAFSIERTHVPVVAAGLCN
ncbi:hypothetical protein PO909_029422 [Leuciscus waleckii]